MGIGIGIGIKRNHLWRLSKGGGLPKWFRDALVCYYDPFKQGLRNGVDINERQTFFLKDFSPNHLDMEMHNFKGGGVSGMNGFGDNFIKAFNQNKCTVSEHTFNKMVITTKEPNKGNLQINSYTIKSLNWDSYKLKVDGLNSEDNIIVYYYQGETKKSITFKGNGIFDVPASAATKTESYPVWMNFKFPEPRTFTLEQLPLAEGALVFDGVDDFGESHNQPKQEGSVISNIESFSYSVQGDVLHLGGQGEPQPLYQFMRFNRFLTEDEQKWVRANFITTPKLIDSTQTDVQL